ncbi:MAG: hypothetical protein QMD36_06500 [Candidatus Aenigmarchaeota archaeon]|nr:hypothetical protein [Candidatus Aenigmarchaeota archaeon]
MKQRTDMSQEKIREWVEFVESHRQIFEKIARGLEKRRNESS